MITLENTERIQNEEETKRQELMSSFRKAESKGQSVFIQQRIDLSTRKILECENFKYALNNNQDLAKVVREAKHEEEARREYLTEWYEKYLDRDQEVATYIQKAIELINERIVDCVMIAKELEA